jgi:hypothetical protein
MVRRPLIGLFYQSRVIDEYGTFWWNEKFQGKLMYSEKTCPSGTLSTTNPTCPGAEPRPPRWESGCYPPDLWHGLHVVGLHFPLGSVNAVSHQTSVLVTFTDE